MINPMCFCGKLEDIRDTYPVIVTIGMVEHYLIIRWDNDRVRIIGTMYPYDGDMLRRLENVLNDFSEE